MPNTIRDNAHAVLLPAFPDTKLGDGVKQFLANGGCSILIGETREEYVARAMTLERRHAEKAETIIALTEQASSLSGNIIVAVDQEISGICRLHDLVPPFPLREEIEGMGNEQFGDICSDIAMAAKELGVDCFLGPILDVVTGDNPWLSGRTWSAEPLAIAEKSSAYIRAIQSNGIAATAKHFPGYSVIELDPAVESEARNMESPQSFKTTLMPFVDAIKSGVAIVMTGPAIVEAFDPARAASISPSVIGVLRGELGFRGVVMSDGLDAKATLRGQPITQVAVEALKAGSDLLLIADIDDQIDLIVSAIVAAVESGDLTENRLHDAATKVRSLAAQYSH
ncbi:MAG: hypothetical protein KJO60_08155 [Desulfofustis sp.]|nr:hypothetical protein [Desulfofustis sp.]NNK57635.1 glycoside hydrolase family 3 protein [Desulfofustis sp.]